MNIDNKEWVRIHGFDHYAINIHGDVINTDTDSFVTPAYSKKTKDGHPCTPVIHLYQNGAQYCKGVNRLVRENFGVNLPGRRPLRYRCRINETGEEFDSITDLANRLGVSVSGAAKAIRDNRNILGRYHVTRLDDSRGD